MVKSISEIQKRGRGRPATGRDPPVTVRLSKEMIKVLNSRAAESKVTRAEIIRRLVELGLKVKTGMKHFPTEE